MSKPNYVGEGGRRAERTPAVGKQPCHFWGWMNAKALLCLSLQVHEVSPKAGCCIVPRRTHASNALPRCRMLLRTHWESRTLFLLQDAQGHSRQQGSSKLYQQLLPLCRVPSADNNMVSLLHQCSLSLFPGGSQVSIGNPATRS